jgi:hypothetical protein
MPATDISSDPHFTCQHPRSQAKMIWRYDHKIIRLVLESVRTLTPPPCANCSAMEVVLYLEERGHTGLTVHSLGTHMGRMHRHGLISTRSRARPFLWSLSERGISMLAGFEAVKTPGPESSTSKDQLRDST